MSKLISGHDLAAIATRLLTQPQNSGELETAEAYQGFMTQIAEAVCDHCGGEVSAPAESIDGTWLVAIRGNDSLPDASGGIWREFDPEGSLYN